MPAPAPISALPRTKSGARRNWFPKASTNRSIPKAEAPYGCIGYPWDVQQGYDEKRYYGVCFGEVWDAVLSGKHHDFVHGMKDVDIKAMIKLHNGNKTNQITNTNKAIQAHRAVEFVLAMDLYMTTTTRYADIVLPCKSEWEDDGHLCFINSEMFIGNPNRRSSSPMLECKSSLEVDALFLEQWGFDPHGCLPYREIDRRKPCSTIWPTRMS